MTNIKLEWGGHITVECQMSEWEKTKKMVDGAVALWKEEAEATKTNSL